LVRLKDRKKKRQKTVEPDNVEAAKTAGLRLLSYQARSESELSERLKKKGYSAATIKQVLADLKRLNLVNDMEFARSWTESRLRSRPMSAASIRWELLGRGIDEKIAAGVVEEVLSEDEELRLAQELVEMRLQKMRLLTEDGALTAPLNKKDYEKLGRFLSGRGFGYQMIRQVINSFLRSGGDE